MKFNLLCLNSLILQRICQDLSLGSYQAQAANIYLAALVDLPLHFFWGFNSVKSSKRHSCRYMADYESTAYMSLERLKEQHGEELSKFQEMIRDSAEVGYMGG